MLWFIKGYILSIYRGTLGENIIFIRNAWFLMVVIFFTPMVFADTLTGTIEVVWGDSNKGFEKNVINYTLVQNNNIKIPLQIDQSVIANIGGLTMIIGKEVIIETTSPVLSNNQQGGLVKNFV